MRMGQLPDPAKHVVWSNLKIGTERVVTPAPNRSRLGTVRECSAAFNILITDH